MIRRSFSSVLGDRRGAVAIIMAIALPVVIGTAGLGVEAGKWYMVKRQAQTAADTGAFAGALELAAGTSNQAKPAAVKETSRNGFTQGGNVTVTVNIPPVSGSHAGNANAVEVIVTRDEPLLFAALFMSEPAGIAARAVGLVTNAGNACILAINPSPPKNGAGLTIGGNGMVKLNECSLASNATGSNSLYFKGSATIQVPTVWAAGGIDVQGNNVTVEIPQGSNTNAWGLPDPYANLTIPTPLPACNHNDYKEATGSVTLTPGVYCGGMEFGSQVTATLEPGTYYIDAGDFKVNAGANVTCNCTTPTSGVTIVLTSSGNANTIGIVDINGNAVISLRAPSVSAPTAQYPFPGILFFQDRRAPPSTNNNTTNKLNGGATMSLDGALYFPSQKVEWSGNSGSDSCTQIVASTVEITGRTTITSSGCEKLGLKPITVKYPSLVE